MKVSIDIGYNRHFFHYEEMIILRSFGFTFKNTKCLGSNTPLYHIIPDKEDKIAIFKDFNEFINFCKIFTVEISYSEWSCTYHKVDLMIEIQ